MLALKISRAKWKRRGYLTENEIRADAITSLRTTDDRLSWWRCTDDEEDVAQVALALAVGPRIDRFDKFDILVLPESILTGAGLASEPNEGETSVKDLLSRHVDLIKLDVERLVIVARILDPRIQSGESVVQFTKTQLITLVTAAIRDERLDANDLNERLRGKLHKSTAGP